MTSKGFAQLLLTTAAVTWIAGLSIVASLQPARSQALSSTGQTQIATATATIKSVNPATRHVVLTNDAGETFIIKVDPSVWNLDQVGVGDRLRATYRLETAYVLSARNKPLPPDTEASVAARAAKGQLPAIVLAGHAIVSGAVLEVDTAKHTLKLVSPKGGEVHTILVQRGNWARLAQVKVGDTITAYETESLLLSVSRP